MFFFDPDEMPAPAPLTFQMMEDLLTKYGDRTGPSAVIVPRWYQELTEKQLQLRADHGTPEEFRRACFAAVPGFISMDEAEAAAEKYEREFWGPFYGGDVTGDGG